MIDRYIRRMRALDNKAPVPELDAITGLVPPSAEAEAEFRRHRGLGAGSARKRKDQEKGWLAYRDKLAGNGFTFEHSATFKEAVVAANDAAIEAAYARDILFDYSYRYYKTIGFSLSRYAGRVGA